MVLIEGVPRWRRRAAYPAEGDSDNAGSIVRQVCRLSTLSPHSAQSAELVTNDLQPTVKTQPKCVRAECTGN